MLMRSFLKSMGTHLSYLVLFFVHRKNRFEKKKPQRLCLETVKMKM